MPDDEVRMLVCEPADAEYVIPGSTFDRRCQRCGRAVMVAPTGERMIQRYPETVCICISCLPILQHQHPEVANAEVVLLAPAAEIKAEVQSFVPNLRRNRN